MKVINPQSKWIYGPYRQNRLLRGHQQNKMVANFSSQLAIVVKHKRTYGNYRERVNLQHIQTIKYVGGYVRVEFVAGTTLVTKQWIRNWLEKNNFVYKDKPYDWTKNITSSTKRLSIGPWSKKPWVVNKAETYSVRAEYI